MTSYDFLWLVFFVKKINLSHLPIPFPNPENFLSGGKFIYTSPLKALSAQKRREFAQIFGPEAVGLVPLANTKRHLEKMSLHGSLKI